LGCTPFVVAILIHEDHCAIENSGPCDFAQQRARRAEWDAIERGVGDVDGLIEQFPNKRGPYGERVLP
jgi:hypothetical protein